MDFNSYFDHTALKADTNIKTIDKLCSEAIDHNFATVCVNPYYVSYCAKKLKNSSVGVCTVVGFPLGANGLENKAAETITVLESGADEVDMVVNVAAIKNESWTDVAEEIATLAHLCHQDNKILKVILETALLTKDEIIKACEVCKKQGADFVKTSTGFSSSGATIDDIALMRKTVGKDMGVKASGGIRSLEDAKAMISAGATRIGASSSVEIIKNIESKSSY